jgi:hypothetical protein
MMSAEPCRYGAPGGDSGPEPRSCPPPIRAYPRNRGPRRGSIGEEKEKGDDPPYADERKLHREH